MYAQIRKRKKRKRSGNNPDSVNEPETETTPPRNPSKQNISPASNSLKKNQIFFHNTVDLSDWYYSYGIKSDLIN